MWWVLTHNFTEESRKRFSSKRKRGLSCKDLSTRLCYRNVALTFLWCPEDVLLVQKLPIRGALSPTAQVRTERGIWMCEYFLTGCLEAFSLLLSKIQARVALNPFMLGSEVHNGNWKKNLLL